MPLQRQVESVPFVKGVELKNNPKLSAKPSRLENAVLRGGSIEKPYGSNSITSALDTGGNLTAGEAMFPFDNELVRLNGGGCYSYGQGNAKWTTKPGNANILTHTLQRITRRSSSQVDFDHANVSNITVAAWSDSGIHVAVYDEVTGDFYQTGAAIISGTSSSWGNPRCVALGAKILVLAANNSNTISCCIVDTANPETVPTLITLQTDATLGSNGSGWDAVGFGSSYAVVSYRNSVSGNITLFAVNSAGTVLGSPAKTNTGLATTGVQPFLHIDGNNVVYVLQAANGNFATFNASTFAAVSAGLVTITGSSMAFAAFAEITTGSVTVFLSQGAGNPTIFMIKAVLSSTAVTSAAANINGTAGLVLQTDGFVLNGVACAVVMSDATLAGTSPLQPTAWVMDSSGNALGKILPGRAYDPHPNGINGRLNKPFTTSAGAIAVLVGEQGRTSYTSQGGTIITTTPGGCTRANILLTKASQVPHLRFGNAVYIGGSLPRIYDGQEMVEAGHNIFPEGGTVAASAGSNLGVGQYQYKLVYSWMNARGEIQRSVPCPAITVNISSGANQAATVTFPTQRLCGRDIVGISKTQLEVYRTEVNGLNFYRVSSVTAPLINDITVASLNFVDNSVTDAQLISNELIYTTGGINDNPAPPAFQLACDHKTRMIIAGLDNPYEYRSSSVTISGEMLRWNESWGGFVPPSTGPITGVASMDGNLYLFTTLAAYVVPGDGPDLLGNNNWVPPQRVMSVDSGPTSAQSLLVAPDGIWFQAAKGLSRLGRDLSFVYAGADVEAYSQNLTVRTAILRPEFEQLWFHADQGTDSAFGSAVVLVWDYHYNQWSALTGSISQTFGAQSVCYFQGLYTRVNSAGVVLQENQSHFKQNGNFIFTVVETEWIKFAGIQGFMRAQRAILLGTYWTDFTITWDAAYSYAGTNPTSPTYNALDTIAFVGNGVFSAGGPFQLRRLLRIQKCEAVKFRFTDSALNGSGQGMALTDLSMILGVRPGVAWKLPPTQSIG